MKVQGLILLGLLCVSTLATITITNQQQSVVVGAVTYRFGVDGSNGCGVSRTEAGTDLEVVWAMAAAGDCAPKKIFSIGTEIWIVAQVNAAGAGAILANGNSASAQGTEYTKVIPTAVTGTVIIAKIVTTNTAGVFGKISAATQFAARTSATNPFVWSAFTISDVTSCSTIIEVKGSTATANDFLVNQANALSTVSGTDVYVDFNTANSKFDGKTATTRVCPAITTSSTVALDGVTYGLGKNGNNCGVTRTQTGQEGLQFLWSTAVVDTDDCEPQAIVNVGTDIWVVAQVSAAGAPLVLANPNSVSAAGTEYKKVIPTAVDGTVIIGRIVITNGATTFGRFNYATQFAAKKADTWGAFNIAEVETCSNNIQLKGDTAADFFLVNQAGEASTVSGDDVYVGFATETQAFGGFTESDKPCSGVILSIASAVVSLVAMLF